jgi:predicted DNA-binding protein
MYTTKPKSVSIVLHTEMFGVLKHLTELEGKTFSRVVNEAIRAYASDHYQLTNETIAELGEHYGEDA